MWDAILDIGRPESSADMLASAQKAFDEADKNGSGTRAGASAGERLLFRANLQGAWDDRENARLGLAAARCSRIWKKPVNWRQGTGLSVSRHS
ncbi:hypothetical protein [Escherichia coli]|uniref:hypothetical protein n=1 Tax=Escherichia coli TaxID=562 RepID=UPI00209B0AAE|nr:hypothetical protein [Escherichia coli]